MRHTKLVRKNPIAIMSENIEDQSLDIVHPVVQNKMKKLLDEMGLIDYTLDIEVGSQKGDNYLGVIAKITIKGKRKDQDVVLNWIAKSAPTLDVLRQLVNVTTSVYGREVHMYENIFSYFKNFQLEKDVLEPFNSYPPFVMSHLEFKEEALVMQDMKVTGYVMKDRMRPLDYNHVKLIMKTYGKFHAISYALKDQRPEKFAEMAENTKEVYLNEMNSKEEGTLKMNDHYNGKVLKILDSVKDTRAYQLYEKFAAKQYEMTNRAINFSNAYSVIGHGDSWVNNMLFKYDNPEYPDNPTNVCLLDFQLARYGSPAFDLSYFIFTCTDHETRAKHYDEMIKLYYYSLCKHLLDMGSDPEKLVSLEAIEKELKNFAFFGMQISVVALYLMMSEKDEVPDMNKASNMDEIADAFNFETKNQGAYDERIRDMVLDVIAYGYLDIFQ